MDAARARELLETSHRLLRARLRELAPAAPARDRLPLLLELGRIQRALASDETEDTLLEAQALAQSLRDAPADRLAAVELGAWLASRGEPAAARPHLERALEASRRATDARAAHDLVTAAAELALARALEKDPAAAEQTLAAARAVLAPSARARLELRAADVARERGDLAAARQGYARALEALALPAAEPLERASVALAARDALDGTPEPRVGARELSALDPGTLALLFEAAVSWPRSPAEARPARALALARHLTGAAGAQLCQGPRVLATDGLARDPDLEARHADLALRLVAAPGAPLGERERLVARAVLAALEGEPAAGTAEAAPTRVLALLDRVLAAGLDLERLVQVATDLAVEATGAARGILLLREAGTHLGFRAARSAGQDLVDPPRIASRSLVREAFLSGRPILLEDAASDPRLGTATSVGGRGLRSVLVAPIPDEDGSTLGVLYLDDPGTIGRFGGAERDVAIGFARRLGAPLRAVLEAERVRAAAAAQARAAASPAARPETRHAFPEIVGRGRAIGSLLALLDRAVESNAPVLILGESGTGKELVARALHRSGPRAKGPFVAVSCSTLAEGVLESELFGHVQGAFTGAVAASPGLFARAHGGVLFLDEIQDASPRLQAELLRVLETGEVRPVGAPDVVRVSVRTVVATNVDLAALVAAGSFREDLYYRLNVIHVRVPPLRERLDDLPDLVAHLLERAGAAGRRLEPLALERLLGAPWPGNVRALRNVLERALVLAGPGPIRAEHVVLEPVRAGPPERATPAAPEPVYVGAVSLNERQLSLLERLRADGEIGNAEHSEREGVTQQTGWRDLTELVQKGVLVRSGRGKKTLYRLAPGWEARIAGR